MGAYQDRLDARRQRLEDRAAATRADAEQRLATVHAEYDAIPFGQPIMGASDARRREKLRERTGRAFRRLDEAKALEQRAAAVGTAGISSDDENAVAKLQAKLAKLDRRQEFMKAVNGAIRRSAKKGADAQVAAMVALGYDGLDEDVARKLLEPDFCGRIGFPSYALSNGNAETRRIRLRIAELEAKAAAPAIEGGSNGDVSWGEDKELNRIWIAFPGKPDDDTRRALKSAGFRWAPSVNRWQRQTSNAAEYHAKRIVEGLAAS
ncbi:DUF3560 domain-containing protein [Desertimonas flava]|uniref:DUF3560 domain-containing protein n=1 Tax=Desertimonas flava TaxID=2064846 RepID=UPI000E344B9A|nr:DUF3560 domain-containing protein [Desertimonas flava]